MSLSQAAEHGRVKRRNNTELTRRGSGCDKSLIWNRVDGMSKSRQILVQELRQLRIPVTIVYTNTTEVRLYVIDTVSPTVMASGGNSFIDRGISATGGY